MFSVGIGGLDLGMGPVVARARGRRVALAGGGSGLASPDAGPSGAPGARRPAADREAREAWRSDPRGLPRAVLPDHGLGRGALTGPLAREFGHHRIEVGRGEAPEGAGAAASWVLAVYGADSPDVRSRRTFLEAGGRAARFERVEEQRILHYEFERNDERLVARLADRARAPQSAGTPTGRQLPPGLALLHVAGRGDGPIESPGVVLRLESWGGRGTRNLEAEFPRPLLQRLVRGREIDRTPEQPLPGLSPLPEALGEVRNLMVLPAAGRWRPPWKGGWPLLGGEEDPLRLGRALGAWWAGGQAASPSAVVGVDADHSPERWASAPRPRDGALLLLPREGFVGPLAAWRKSLVEAWGPSRVVDDLPDDTRATLVLLVSAEPPGSFGTRLRELARDERMRGRLLAAWSLAGPVREDLPGSLIEEGQIAGFGLAEHSLVSRRRTAETIRALRDVLTAATDELRAEQLPGPFLWYF
jgi:hypothetical protein